MLIKDIAKLLQSNIHNHDKRYWCCQCLNISYNSQEKLNEHLQLCMNPEAVKAINILPQKKKNIGNREDIVFVCSSV